MVTPPGCGGSPRNFSQSPGARPPAHSLAAAPSPHSLRRGGVGRGPSPAGTHTGAGSGTGPEAGGGPTDGRPGARPSGQAAEAGCEGRTGLGVSPQLSGELSPQPEGGPDGALPGPRSRPAQRPPAPPPRPPLRLRGRGPGQHYAHLAVPDRHVCLHEPAQPSGHHLPGHGQRRGGDLHEGTGRPGPGRGCGGLAAAPPPRGRRAAGGPRGRRGRGRPLACNPAVCFSRPPCPPRPPQLRARDPASRGDRYMLVTFEEPPYSRQGRMERKPRNVYE